MRTLFAVLLLSVCACAQGLGGNAGMGGKAGIGGGAVAAPTAAPTRVQGIASNGAFGATATLVFGSNLTSGNILVVWAFSGGGPASWGTPTCVGTGCASTTWTAQGTCAVGSDGECLWTGIASGTGAGTVTMSQTSGFDITGYGVEVSGGTTTGMVLSNYDVNIGCINCTGATVTTSTNNNLLLTFLRNGGTTTSPSPFSIDFTGTDSIGLNFSAGSYTQVSSGLYTPTWTQSSANQTNVSISIPHP